MKRPRSGGKKKIISLRTLALILAAIILGLSIYRWNAESLMGDKMPMPFGYGASVVLSGSMEPAICVDDLVIVKETQEVQPGDVAVYQSGDILIIHRVMEVSGDTIIMKGDANASADAPISRQDIKGKWIFTIPRAGVVVTLLRQPAAIFAVIAAAVVLTEMSYRKEKSKDDDELEILKKEIYRLKEEVKEHSEENERGKK